MNTERKAIVIATGKEITVYRLKKGGWADSSNCTTEYKDSELNFKN